MPNKLVSYRLNQKSTDTIDKLKEDLACSSKSDVVRKAIILLDTVNRINKDNGDVFVERPDGEQYLINIELI